jgi:iron(III) transport system permease protein
MTTMSLAAIGDSPDQPRRLRRARFVASLSPFSLIAAAIAIGMALLGVIPLGAMVWRIVSGDGAGILEALGREDVVGLVRNTLIVVAISTVFALLIGAALAWINERTDASMGLLSEAMPMVPFMLPPIAGSIGWVLLLSPNAGYINGALRGFLGLFGINSEVGPLDIYSWYGLIFVYTIYAVPYSFLMCTSGLRNFDPALEEQSQVSGASLGRTLRKVTLPGMLPSLLAATMLILMSSFGLFSIPSVIGAGADIPILSVRIVRLLSFTYPPEVGAAIGLSLIVVLFVGGFWFLQTRALKHGRFATIGGKGARANRIRLGRARPVVRALVILYLVVTTILPLLALVIVSLNGFWTLDIDWGGLNLDAFVAAVFEDRSTRRALTNSLTFGLIGSLVGIVAAALASLYIVRSRSRFARIIDGGIKFPSLLSHIVIAVGFVLAFGGEPFRLSGTAIILIGAYLALYLPQASIAADASVGQIARELPEASRVAGASELRTIGHIYAPLMLPGLIAGWALLFVRMIGDLSASAILAGTRNNVVGFRILEIYQNGSFASLASLSTALTLISAIIVVGVLFLSRRVAGWSRTTTGGK